jgi:RNA polymerase sigma-70 factor (ECF subfamily)
MTQLISKKQSDDLETILEGCRKKDLHAQEKLYRQCYAGFIKMCYRYAGDMDGAGTIFNNAFLRVFKNIDKYHHENRLMGWIKTIVLNCCLDYVKQKHKIHFETLGPIHEEEIGIADEILDNVSVKEIQKIINELPKTTATVFNLFIYEGCTHKEIGELLKIAEGTSKWHVNEGRRILKIKLEKLFQ